MIVIVKSTVEIKNLNIESVIQKKIGRKEVFVFINLETKQSCKSCSWIIEVSSLELKGTGITDPKYL